MRRPTHAEYGGPPAGDGDDGTVDLRRLWGAIRRRKLVILLPTVLAFAASLAVVNVLEPRYVAATRVVLETRDSVYTRPTGENRDQTTIIDPEAVGSQVQVVTSRDLAQEAIRSLGLARNPEFNRALASPSLSARLALLVGLRSAADEPEERVLEEYDARLTAYAVPRSRVIAIEFGSRDPELAARAANTIADLYIRTAERAKRDTARDAGAWLNSTIIDLRARLAQAENRVEEFRIRNGLFAGGNNLTVSAQQLAELSTQLSSARATQADSEARARLIQDMIRAGRTFEIPDVANNELVRRLIETRVNLRSQIALESRTLLPGHPRIKELNAQVADLDGQIRSAAQRQVRILENEAKLAGSRVASLNAAIEQQKRATGGSAESEVQLRALEREARTIREQLESFLTRNRDAEARDAAASTPADARIISRAVVPERPVFPKKLPIVAASTFAMFLVALFAVAAREALGAPQPERAPAFRDSPPEPPAAEPPAAELPVVAPPATEAVPGPATAAPSPPAAPDDVPWLTGLPAPVGGVVARAVAIDRAQQSAGLLLVLADGGEGDDATAPMPAALAPLALRIARGMAAAVPTVAVDLDVARSPLASSSGLPPQPGLAEALSGAQPVADLIQRDPGSALHVVGAGARDAGFDLARDADAFDEIVAALADAYSGVVLAATDRTERLDELAAAADLVAVVAVEASPAVVALRRRLEAANGAEVELVLADAAPRLLLTDAPDASPRDRAAVPVEA